MNMNMKNVVVSIFLNLAVLSVVSGQWVEFETKRYFFSDDKLTFENAISSCQNRGGNLAMVGTMALHNFLRTEINSLDGDKNFFIRARQSSDANATLVWPHNSATQEGDGSNNTPGTAMCYHLDLSDMISNDIPCANPQRYICESAASPAGCTAYGDPHYLTFDGSGWFDFQGTCIYYLARTNSLATGDRRWFSVTAKNANRNGNTVVSYVDYVEVSLQGGDLIIRLGQNRQILVNSIAVLGYNADGVSVTPSGLGVVLSTTSGLRVTYNGHAVTITLQPFYKGKVNGICGTYNSNPADDLTTESGEVVTSFQVFAQSYQVGSCTNPTPPPFECADPERWETTEFCGALTDPSSSLAACNATVDVSGYFEKCVYDCCATNGDRQVLTEALQAYADKCKNEGVTEVCNWRSTTNTPLPSCPRGSVYQACASPCSNSCLFPNATNNCAIQGTVEDCVCSDSNRIKEGNRCVRSAGCGCLVDGNYVRQEGDIYLPNKNVTCSGRGVTTTICNAGFNGEDCADINECETGEAGSCQQNEVCTNTYGSYACRCKPGYIRDEEACIDIDECRENLNNCSSSATCTNTIGSFTCACNIGYTGNGYTCTDIDECQVNSNACGSDATCTNTVGSFTCACNSGYTGNGQTCTDIDECQVNSNACSSNAVCTNTAGSFTCVCNTGYTGNGQTCSDVDECQEDSGKCGPGGACSNTVGSFTCECQPGYTKDGQSCTDINECQVNSNACSPKATCTNTPGSFTCACNSGYTGNGQTCSDINECTVNSNACSSDATCTNTVGSFTCACNSGYTGNGQTCSDINECTVNSNACGSNAVCTNTVGGFTCACNSGYTGNGQTCSDINECQVNSNACSSDATCTNTAGSFICKCKPGYEENGQTCTDIDECQGSSNACGSNSACTNTAGSYTCKCKPGYQGNGKNCTDINECQQNLHDCGHFSSCVNEAGGFTCQCKQGYRPEKCEA